MTSLIDLAARIATEAHKGQTRWDGKTPYISHPAAVANALAKRGLGDEVVAVAWLHDVLEDTSVTKQELISQGIPLSVATSVELLTKSVGDSYLNYLLRLRNDPGALLVKIEDIKHNMSDLKKSGSLYQKYELALHILEGEIHG